MLHSIRYRLLAWFIIFMLLTFGILIPIELIFRSKEEKISIVTAELSSLHLKFLHENRVVNEFLSAESFYSEKETGTIAEQRQLSGELNTRLVIFSLSDEVKPFNIKPGLDGLIHLYNRYNQVFDSLVYKRAYMRFGGIKTGTNAGWKEALAILKSSSNEIEAAFGELESRAQKAQLAQYARLKTGYVFSIIVILAVAVCLSYMASKMILTHIGSLTNNLLSQMKLWENQRDSAIQNADDNQQRYRELADLLPQSVFETDSYGNYTYVNKAWYQSFGYTSQDLNDGLNLIETLISSDSNPDEILGIKKIENSTFMAVRKNGTRFPASVYTDNIITNGKNTGRRGIIVDITDKVDYIKSLQQETSRARTSDELKSSFLANMSHEIRTPMNSIIGFSNLLASEQVPETQKKDFTQYIQTSSEILLNLVDDIIDIAKIEAGELKIVKKDCDLNALGEELLSTSFETRKKFSKQHIQIRFLKDSNQTEVCLKTDPFRLRQILINLINNAIKFTDKGYIEFGYSVKDDTQVEFYVRDTGPGLSREDLDHIFERFKRAKRSEERNIAGTGLGLAISKNLVQLLGGEMWVNSSAESGTTFMFTLPYLRTTVLPSVSDGIYSPAEDYNWSGKKILIVEDDLNSVKFLKELLRKSGIYVIHASNGREAVELFRSDPTIHVVLMDIQLPVLDGLEATKLIKEIKNDVPVIAQTAYAMSGDKEKMKKAGCDDYVSKPLNSRQLQAVINHFLFTPAESKEQKHSSSSSIVSHQDRS